MQQAPHNPGNAGGSPETPAPRTEHGEAVRIDRWQLRLLPTMTRMVVGLALFFFVASFAQLLFLQWSMLQGPGTRIEKVLETIRTRSDDDLVQGEILRLGVAAAQEADLADRRYHMGRVTLMAHLWIRYLGFVTGMIMAAIGAVFILGKLREERSEISAEYANVKFTLLSASPGLLLAILGSALMIVTVLHQQGTRITDAAPYMPATEPETNPVTGLGGTVDLPAKLQN